MSEREGEEYVFSRFNYAYYIALLSDSGELKSR